MTTIAGATNLNETVLIVDSSLSIGGLHDMAPSKLMIHNSTELSLVPPFALAGAGSLRSLQVVFAQIEEAIHKVKFDSMSGGMDFALAMGNATRSILRADGSDLGSATFLLATMGQLYAFDDGGAVHIPVRGYFALGSGDGYAMGAMYAMQGCAPLPLCISAIKAAASMDHYTRPPFVWARVFTSSVPVESYIETGRVES